MARSRSTSRKSTKKCSSRQVAVKSHRHGSKKVKAMCRKSPKSRSRSPSRRTRSRGSGKRTITFVTKEGRKVTFKSAGRRRKTSRPMTKYQKFVKSFAQKHPEIPGGPKLIKAAAKEWNPSK
jgi:hypothetical protein